MVKGRTQKLNVIRNLGCSKFLKYVMYATLCVLLCGFFVFVPAVNSAQPHDKDKTVSPEKPNRESIGNYQVIIDKNLFLPLGTNFDNKPRVSEFKLILTLIYDNGKKKALFVNRKTGQTSYVSEGEKLEDGAQVVKISEKRVKLVKDGQEMVQSLNMFYIGASDKSRPPRPPQEGIGEQKGQKASVTEKTRISSPRQRFKAGTLEWREAFKKRKLEELRRGRQGR